MTTINEQRQAVLDLMREAGTEIPAGQEEAYVKRLQETADPKNPSAFSLIDTQDPKAQAAFMLAWMGARQAGSGGRGVWRGMQAYRTVLSGATQAPDVTASLSPELSRAFKRLDSTSWETRSKGLADITGLVSSQDQATQSVIVRKLVAVLSGINHYSLSNGPGWRLARPFVDGCNKVIRAVFSSLPYPLKLDLARLLLDRQNLYDLIALPIPDLFSALDPSERQALLPTFILEYINQLREADFTALVAMVADSDKDLLVAAITSQIKKEISSFPVDGHPINRTIRLESKEFLLEYIGEVHARACQQLFLMKALEHKDAHLPQQLLAGKLASIVTYIPAFRGQDAKGWSYERLFGFWTEMSDLYFNLDAQLGQELAPDMELNFKEAAEQREELVEKMVMLDSMAGRIGLSLRVRNYPIARLPDLLMEEKKFRADVADALTMTVEGLRAKLEAVVLTKDSHPFADLAYAILAAQLDLGASKEALPRYNRLIEALGRLTRSVDASLRDQVEELAELMTLVFDMTQTTEIRALIGAVANAVSSTEKEGRADLKASIRELVAHFSGAGNEELNTLALVYLSSLSNHPRWELRYLALSFIAECMDTTAPLRPFLKDASGHVKLLAWEKIFNFSSTTDTDWAETIRQHFESYLQFFTRFSEEELRAIVEEEDMAKPGLALALDALELLGGHLGKILKVVDADTRDTLLSLPQIPLIINLWRRHGGWAEEGKAKRATNCEPHFSRVAQGSALDEWQKIFLADHYPNLSWQGIANLVVQRFEQWTEEAQSKACEQICRRIDVTSFHYVNYLVCICTDFEEQFKKYTQEHYGKDKLDMARMESYQKERVLCVISVMPDLMTPEQVLEILDLALKAVDHDKREESISWTTILGHVMRAHVETPLMAQVWQKMGLKNIDFKDGGNGHTGLPILMGALLMSDPNESLLAFLRLFGKEPTIKPQETFVTKVLEDVLSEFAGIDKQNVRQLGRSTVYDIKGTPYVLVHKLANGHSLEQELEWLAHIDAQRVAWGLRSDYPLPLRDEAGSLIKTAEGIVFMAPKNYYRYLDDPTLSDAEFWAGLNKAVHDVFALSRHDIYHTAPLPLFHNREDGAGKRPSGDRGKYAVIPDLVFNYGSRYGMGRLDNWPASIRHANIGANGLRDLEELATRNQIWADHKRFAPELGSLIRDDNKFNSWLDPLVLGKTLLAVILFAGNRMRNALGLEHRNTAWQDERFLGSYAVQLRDTFATALAGKTGIDLEKAKSFVSPKADWMRLARQLAFFMTPAYVNYIKAGAHPDNFPDSIYGFKPNLHGGNPYRPGTFDDEVGFVGPDGKTDELSLGPVNGQFPVREFETALWSVFFGVMMVDREVRAGELAPAKASADVTVGTEQTEAVNPEMAQPVRRRRRVGKQKSPDRSNDAGQVVSDERQSPPVSSNGSGMARPKRTEGEGSFSAGTKLAYTAGRPGTLPSSKPETILTSQTLTSQTPMAIVGNTANKTRQAHLVGGINSGNHGAARMVAHPAGSWGQVGAARAVAMRHSFLRGR